jgi:CobQ-like glutamine amidotransferase family enzyme
MSEPVRIGLVLPDVMGTYGDGGNAVVLRQRLRLRGIPAEIIEITLAGGVPDSLDLYTLGGAEDYAQRLATRHLLRHPGLQRAAIHLKQEPIEPTAYFLDELIVARGPAFEVGPQESG